MLPFVQRRTPGTERRRGRSSASKAAVMRCETVRRANTRLTCRANLFRRFVCGPLAISHACDNQQNAAALRRRAFLRGDSRRNASERQHSVEYIYWLLLIFGTANVAGFRVKYLGASTARIASVPNVCRMRYAESVY